MLIIFVVDFHCRCSSFLLLSRRYYAAIDFFFMLRGEQMRRLPPLPLASSTLYTPHYAPICYSAMLHESVESTVCYDVSATPATLTARR